MDPHAVVVIIRDHQGKILMVGRKDQPQNWGLPGGKVEKGELVSKAAIREVYEETGLRLNFEYLKYVCTLREHKPIIVLVYIARFGNHCSLHPGIGEAPAKWGDESEVCFGTRFAEINQEIFKQLKEEEDNGRFTF